MRGPIKNLRVPVIHETIDLMRKSLLFTSLCLSTILSAQVAPWAGVTLAQGTAGAPTLNFSGDARTGIYSSGAGTLNFSTGGTNALTIQSNGDLTLNSGLNVMSSYVHIQLHGEPFLHDDGVANLGVGFLALAVTSGYWEHRQRVLGA